jgi:polysaccharide biosynthesis/export protein
MTSSTQTFTAALFAVTLSAAVLAAQAPAPPAQAPAPAPPAAAAPAPTKQPSAAGPTVLKPAAPVTAPTGVTLPSDYVIGPDDILIIVFWREKELSSEALVRPDGRISIPVLQDVEAAGLTPEQLRVKLTEIAEKYVEDPNVTVVVKQINSRRVYITGQVAKPGP